MPEDNVAELKAISSLTFNQYNGCDWFIFYSSDDGDFRAANMQLFASVYWEMSWVPRVTSVMLWPPCSSHPKSPTFVEAAAWVLDTTCYWIILCRQVHLIMSKPENIIEPRVSTPGHLCNGPIPQTGLLENIAAKNQPPTWNRFLIAANDIMIYCADQENESHYNIIISVIREAYLKWYGLRGRRMLQAGRYSFTDDIKIIVPKQHFLKISKC